MFTFVCFMLLWLLSLLLLLLLLLLLPLLPLLLFGLCLCQVTHFSLGQHRPRTMIRTMQLYDLHHVVPLPCVVEGHGEIQHRLRQVQHQTPLAFGLNPHHVLKIPRSNLLLHVKVFVGGIARRAFKQHDGGMGALQPKTNHRGRPQSWGCWTAAPTEFFVFFEGRAPMVRGVLVPRVQGRRFNHLVVLPSHEGFDDLFRLPCGGGVADKLVGVRRWGGHGRESDVYAKQVFAGGGGKGAVCTVHFDGRVGRTQGSEHGPEVVVRMRGGGHPAIQSNAMGTSDQEGAMGREGVAMGRSGGELVQDPGLNGGGGGVGVGGGRHDEVRCRS